MKKLLTVLLSLLAILILVTAGVACYLVAGDSQLAQTPLDFEGHSYSLLFPRTAIHYKNRLFSVAGGIPLGAMVLESEYDKSKPCDKLAGKQAYVINSGVNAGNIVCQGLVYSSEAYYTYVADSSGSQYAVVVFGKQISSVGVDNIRLILASAKVN